MASPQEFVVMGADVNTQISWTADGDKAVPRGTSTKFQNVLNLLSSKNMAAVAQEDPRVHNQWIRKTPSAGFQIDIAASTNAVRIMGRTRRPDDWTRCMKELRDSETKELNGDMRSGMMRPRLGCAPMG